MRRAMEFGGRSLRWWEASCLKAIDNKLYIDGQSVETLATTHGTPIYVYSSQTIRSRLNMLREALRSTGAKFRINFAMKCNRSQPVLSLMRNEGDICIDTCSPREVERALSFGFHAHEVSVTAGMLSNRDLEQFAHFGVHLNLDTFSVIRRYASTPGHQPSIGLRIDPGVKVGWGENEKLAYGDSKFGFQFFQIGEVIRFAESVGLTVDTLHVHPGWGLQQSSAPLLAKVYEKLAAAVREFPSIRIVNVGGGLCGRQRECDEPLSSTTWGELLTKHIAPTGVTIHCEPGTFVMHDAGILISEVNTVETRPSGNWIGLNTGHNQFIYCAHYGIPCAILTEKNPLVDLPEASSEKTNNGGGNSSSDTAESKRPLTPVLYDVAGNINEANDVFGRKIALNPVEEGDLVVFFPAGAYGSSMSSDHCMRSLPNETMI